MMRSIPANANNAAGEALRTASSLVRRTLHPTAVTFITVFYMEPNEP